ncbi:hypothetical protein COO91_04857 [Nostoc flagelliforme CCNUN1]|uniref:Uncharacterized protein n=1 Tax=Nostoc flagelliforme CCNUN1 TaxID=2038116 RepID=A0A2K8SU61_9NOSO|nr:hypothetical protein COO91_04857 [Nostoc flagelliforme CCNUN1]
MKTIFGTAGNINLHYQIWRRILLQINSFFAFNEIDILNVKAFIWFCTTQFWTFESRVLPALLWWLLNFSKFY